ncbi:hypothetical protein AG0111_0g5586 [Alternaria gaisen]|uniref:Uncharacterized protein n=1 Tax=Alternaria gaisen TaxID=167740 RepID=A0ACB6FNA5_9PLEO|nr:hypothetical protein AG0111_0g5586 [Alternaria gaisen]
MAKTSSQRRMKVFQDTPQVIPLTARHDPEAEAARIRLQLGAYPQEADLQEDVRAALQDEDAKNAPRPGQPSLVEEFEQRIKQEPTEDGPSREFVPLPPL